jgi:hypothetical protein
MISSRPTSLPFSRTKRISKSIGMPFHMHRLPSARQFVAAYVQNELSEMDFF